LYGRINGCVWRRPGEQQLKRTDAEDLPKFWFGLRSWSCQAGFNQAVKRSPPTHDTSRNVDRQGSFA
jgi:hypothetical protein